MNADDYASGTSFISVVARTEREFFDTIDFYTKVGFGELYVYNRNNPDQQRDPAVSATSEQETWLTRSSPAKYGSNTTLKVRYVSEALHWQATASARRQSIYEPGTGARTDKDWRGTQEAIVFYVASLEEIISTLKEIGVEYQLQPNPHHPCEVYTHDPVNTLIGFTNKKNPYSTIKPLFFKNMEEQKARTAPGTPGGKGALKKKLAVMTSGGDAPGMCAAVRAVVRTAIVLNCDAFVIKEGYDGLVRGGEMIEQFGWEDVRGWLSEGGTLIGTARCKAFRERYGRLQSAKNLVEKGIDALIVIGGDGSLTGADLFRSEWPGLLKELVEKGEIPQELADRHAVLTICGTVGSIDNDMSKTDATIGCYSSLTRICQAIDFIDATASSHQRAFVVEVMGRHCGWLGLMSGISTGADFIFIPENPPNEGWEAEMCATVKKV